MKILLGVSFLVCVLVVTASYTGMFSGSLYAHETYSWQLQCIGQDLVNICIIAPFLLITAILLFCGIKKSMLLWMGCLLYLVYTYLIYCFDIHFNEFFIEYCIILGLSFYLSLYSFYFIIKNKEIAAPGRAPYKLTGVFFIFVAAIFYFLWLSEIIPAQLANTIPAALHDSGLFTNPVQVIDLSVVLPGIVTAGILLLKGSRFSAVIAPVLLTFFILMDITIAVLSFFMAQKTAGASMPVIFFMTLLALFSIVLLISHLRPRSAVNKSKRHLDNIGGA